MSIQASPSFFDPDRKSAEVGILDFIERSGRPGWLIGIHLINRREVIETLGYAAESALKIDFLNRLKEIFQDVFLYQDGRIALLTREDLAQEDKTDNLMTTISEQASGPFVVDGVSVRLQISMGLVRLDPSQHYPCSCWLQMVDTALRKAEEDDSIWARFDPEMVTAGRDSLALLGTLKTALVEGQFRLRLQPKISVSTGQPLGAEALIRWHHPDKGIIPPVAFIPQAEKTELIHDLFWWCLEEAIRILQRWEDDSTKLPIAINLSPRNLQIPNLTHRILEKLSAEGIDPEWIEFEVTETAIIKNVTDSRRIFSRLKDAGISLSIDDFGVGHSSLHALSEIPASHLKIDRSLIQKILKSPETRKIVRHALSLAHGLNMQAIAEGVENGETLTLLSQMNCDLAQGFHILAPVEEKDLREWLGSQPATAPR